MRALGEGIREAEEVGEEGQCFRRRGGSGGEAEGEG